MDNEKIRQLQRLEAEINATQARLHMLEESAQALRESDDNLLDLYQLVDESDSWALIREELSYELQQIQERLKVKNRLQKS